MSVVVPYPSVDYPRDGVDRLGSGIGFSRPRRPEPEPAPARERANAEVSDSSIGSNIREPEPERYMEKRLFDAELDNIMKDINDGNMSKYPGIENVLLYGDPTGLSKRDIVGKYLWDRYGRPTFIIYRDR